MDAPMSPQKWQEYLAAFRTFGQNASKYRNFPKDPKIKNGDIPHPAESQSVKASPEPPKGSVAAGFNTSRGASSTVFTYPESGKPVTNTAGTAPSTVSSKATKKDESELKYGSKQPVNGTSLGKTSKASTHKLFAPGSPPRSSFSKASTSRGPTASINFSTSTMQPTTPDRLANDCNNSVRSEIGSDDVIVFRQNEYNRVGPRLYPHKQGTQSEENIPSAVAHAKVTCEKTTAHYVHGQGEKMKQNQADDQTASNKNAKKMTIEEKRAELHRVQQEELARIKRKQLGLDDDYCDTGPLHLAREGPGTDPNSNIARGIRRYVLEAPKNHVPALPAPETTPERRDATGMEIVAANSSLVAPVHHAQASIERQENGTFQSVLVDWQYRPWHMHDDEWTRSFGDWLEFTLRLGCWVDTDSGPFTSPDYHPDGIHGFVKPKFDEPIALLEESVEENERAHETAAGYVYNWNLRIEREKLKEKEDKKREIAHRKALAQIKPEPHPYAPRTNIYLRPIQDKDIPKVTELYNWYVVNSVRCIELEETSEASMKSRINENEAAGLPCIVAAEHKPGRGYAMNSEDELIYGFIMASEMSGPRTANRYTAEVELYINPTKYNRRVGRSLLDKMVGLCNPKYNAKRGYTFDNAGPKAGLYCGATIKPLSRLIFIIHHTTEDVSEYEWFKTWLGKEFGFTEQGVLKGTAIKQNKVLNSAYLVHSTPLEPESKGDKEVVNWRYGKDV